MARDKYHYHVREALEKEGWIVTHDPYQIHTPGLDYPVDLGAEKVLAAERGAEKIAVEIKSFLKGSMVSEFHTAFGQFLLYNFNLQRQEPERLLYLALPARAFKHLIKFPAIADALDSFNIRLIIYKPDTKIIELWKK